MPVKLSDELVERAREEARAADRSITSQIEHWARLGRTVETLLRHEEVLALKRAGDDVDTGFAPQTRRSILAVIRRAAADTARPELASMLTSGRTVYQDDGRGRIERIEPDGRRSVGRFVNRQFTPDEPSRASRRR